MELLAASKATSNGASYVYESDTVRRVLPSTSTSSTPTPQPPLPVQVGLITEFFFKLLFKMISSFFFSPFPCLPSFSCQKRFFIHVTQFYQVFKKIFKLFFSIKVFNRKSDKSFSCSKLFSSMLPSFTQFFYSVVVFPKRLAAKNRCTRTSLSFTQFYLVLPSFTQFYLVIPSVTLFF